MKYITYNSHASDRPMSWAIRFFSKGWTSHTSKIYDGFVYEAIAGKGKGYTETPVSEWDGSTVVASRKVFVPEDRRDILKSWLKNQVGKKYDYWGVLSFVWRHTKARKGYWFCSEAAMESLHKIFDVDSVAPGHDNRVSPTEFWKVLDYTLAITKINEHTKK